MKLHIHAYQHSSQHIPSPLLLSRHSSLAYGVVTFLNALMPEINACCHVHKNGLYMRAALVRPVYDVNVTWHYAFCISQHATGIRNVRHQKVNSHCGCNGIYQHGLITTTVCYKHMLLSLFFPSIRIIPRILWVSIKNSE